MYLLLSLVVVCIITHGEYDARQMPSGSTVGLLKQNTEEGRCLLEKKNSEMVPKAALSMFLYPALWFLGCVGHVCLFCSAAPSLLVGKVLASKKKSNEIRSLKDYGKQ